MMWWLWFDSAHAPGKKRSLILTAYLVCPIALVISKASGLIFPFRTRPIYVPELGLVVPHSAHVSAFEEWSAMPSDHAVLFFF
ncbi:MAG: hypothetical protein Q8R76_10470 [Candidatus Omnitrophota bacterium]|nr:hypothetical protein [Candidatus Omnitrophota bacterium]